VAIANGKTFLNRRILDLPLTASFGIRSAAQASPSFVFTAAEFGTRLLGYGAGRNECARDSRAYSR
jgi:hypothetical protein